MSKVRKRLYKHEAEFLNLPVRKNDKGRNTARYRIDEDDWEKIKDARSSGILSVFDRQKIDPKTGKYLWIKDKKASTFVKNPLFVDSGDVEKEIDFDKIFEGKINPIEIKSDTIDKCVFDRLVFTDVHIGMNVNPDGFSLYSGEWNEEVLFERLGKMTNYVVNSRKSKIIYVDDLGDFLDGWNGQTARGGHDLPQNMDNQKAFDVGLKFKLQLCRTLVQYYEKVIFHNVCEDNHAAAFGYVLNSAFKTIAEQQFAKKVEVHNVRKFIDYYQATEKHVFCISHGKDSKNLKFGFKPILDKNQENKIDNWLKANDLIRPHLQIEFSKGDSHQYILDYSTSQNFHYCSYPAFSPASSWVQTNFQKGISGFHFSNYFDNTKIDLPFFF
jgi:hypothetical protein